jgi:hypothetical protein
LPSSSGVVEAQFIHVELNGIGYRSTVVTQVEISFDTHSGVMATIRNKQRIEGILVKNAFENFFGTVACAFTHGNLTDTHLDCLGQWIDGSA